MSKDKIRIVELPDPFNNKNGYIAFYGNYPIPSKGRHSAFNKSGTQLTFAEVVFPNLKSCILNAEWYIKEFKVGLS